MGLGVGAGQVDSTPVDSTPVGCAADHLAPVLAEGKSWSRVAMGLQDGEAAGHSLSLQEAEPRLGFV